MIKTGVVYELVDPRDGSCRYVGATFDAARRHRQHCDMTWQVNIRLSDWKDELYRAGLSPAMNVLESDIPALELFEKEKLWCRVKSQSGAALLNLPTGKITKADLFTPADSAVVGDFSDEICRLIGVVLERYSGKLPTKVYNALWKARDAATKAKWSCPHPP